MKGIRMKPDLIAKIEGAKELTGINSFSDRVRFLIERQLSTGQSQPNPPDSTVPAAEAEMRRRKIKS